MMQNGRQVQNEFSKNELLFLRVKKNDLLPNGRLDPNKTPTIPDLSMNRSAMGGAWWFVLIPDPIENGDPESTNRMNNRIKQGVYRIGAFDLPKRSSEDNKNYYFRLNHDPYEYNYQHSELRVHDDNNIQMQRSQLKGKKLREVKKYYRTMFSRNSKPVVKPHI